MKKIRLGRTGIDVSAVSLGTWGHGGPNKAGDLSIGWSGHDDDLAQAALKAAFEAGIDHWDTADVYGNGHAEALIGRMWGEIPRSKIFLASKVGWDPGPYDHFYHPQQIEKQLTRSLENLRTDVIDLYYLHHCDFGESDAYFDDAIGLLRRFQEQGKIRFIGLSDWSSEKILRFADRVNPDVVQPYRNVADDSFASSGLKAWVEEHQAGVAFFSPIKHGLLLGKYEAPREFPEGDFRRNVPGFRDPAVIAKMRANKEKLTERFRDHPEPVLNGLIGALLEDTPTGCVLLGMRNPKQVQAASQVGEPLDSEDAAWVRALYG